MELYVPLPMWFSGPPSLHRINMMSLPINCDRIPDNSKLEDPLFTVYDVSKVESPCSICFSEFEMRDELTVLPCGHHYHASCLNEWFVVKVECPMCRMTDIDRELSERARLVIKHQHDAYERERAKIIERHRRIRDGRRKTVAQALVIFPTKAELRHKRKEQTRRHYSKQNRHRREKRFKGNGRWGR